MNNYLIPPLGGAERLSHKAYKSYKSHKSYKTYKPSSPTLGGAPPASAWFPTIRHQRFTARQARPSRGFAPTSGTRVLCVGGHG